MSIVGPTLTSSQILEIRPPKNYIFIISLRNLCFKQIDDGAMH